ncbi:MAG: alpha/beta fold hydrolase [Candidatus Leucobacter sulfamidivorax]|nr:alpha/beta fold hydrolase [Candidatus Leucobacter sulfamidivorax]
MGGRGAGRGRRFGAGRIILLGVSVLLGVAVAIVGARLVGDALDRAGIEAFYAAPAQDGADAAPMPGTLIRSEALPGAPFDARAWRVMYWTTDVHGDPVPVTGTVIVPVGAAPDAGRTVLAWGHPTTGTAPECAPSRGFDPFIGIEGLRMMLDRGYTVVATDYVGMGTTAADSYLIGVTAGNSMLDGVRAARSLPLAQAGSSVVLWGHSQGGQAALFAAEQAADYAPELTIEAVAVAAPAADLSALMGSHLDDVSGATIGSYAFQAYAQVYAGRGAELDGVLTPAAIAILPEMNRLCLLSHLGELHAIAEPVVGDFFSADPTKTAPWAQLLAENSAGGRAFDAPLFVAQGADDALVLPADTERFVAHEEGLGMRIEYRRVPLADHGTIAYLSLPWLDAWLDAQGV